jgi:hypothetical protein
MGDMERDESKRGKRPIVTIAVLILAVLLVLYPLSAGPVIYLQTSGRLIVTKDSAIGRFYAPLNWAEAKCRPFGRLMQRYGSLWVSRP